jgi:hypothetical protein
MSGPVNNLEQLISQAAESDNFDTARKILRNWLFNQTGVPIDGGSIGDPIAVLATKPNPPVIAAKVVLRCLAVPNLLPPANAANQLTRHVVSLCESALPDICDFLSIPSQKQNYAKFNILSSAHARVLDILSPLRAKYVGINSVLAARKPILSALSHSIIRSYCEPFGLAEVRSTIETLFNQLQRVSLLEATLLSDIDEYRRTLADGRSFAVEAPSFLSCEFLLPLIASAEVALDAFISSASDRFTTGIIRSGVPGPELQKRYPLLEPGRQIQLLIPMRNIGPGLATNVRASITGTAEELTWNTSSVFVGNIRPGDFALVFDGMVITPTAKVEALIEVEWGEIGDVKTKSEIFDISIVSQRSDIDWSALNYRHPYSTQEATGSDFVGREEKVKEFASKLLRNPMEPFYITGQKRVGKTSLALAAADFARDHSDRNYLAYKYILWPDMRRNSPADSVRDLGETIEAFMLEYVPVAVRPSRASYEGSLSGLMKLSDIALQHVPERRFVIIIDEFDDIPQELFLAGNLAETFFSNLRALTARRNICLVLVGGENMPFIMARQGEKLNKLSKHDLNYYARDTEWEDYKLLIRKPTDAVINWHDDAINEIYNFTNGNPFFTKLLCARIFAAALRERDADVTATEVQRAIQKEISSLDVPHFLHLWKDGIFKPLADREPDIVRRMKVLVAIGRCSRRGLPITSANIADKHSSSLSDAEITQTLNDFMRRGVLREEGGAYVFNLPLFGLWLIDVGLNKLIEELARGIQAQEDAAHVRSEEIVLSYRASGRHIEVNISELMRYVLGCSKLMVIDNKDCYSSCFRIYGSTVRPTFANDCELLMGCFVHCFRSS